MVTDLPLSACESETRRLTPTGIAIDIARRIEGRTRTRDVAVEGDRVVLSSDLLGRLSFLPAEARHIGLLMIAAADQIAAAAPAPERKAVRKRRSSRAAVRKTS